MRIDTLLCPISLSANSKNLLQAAAFLAQRSGARLKLLHVLDPRDVSAVAHLSAFEKTPLEVSARMAAKALFEASIPKPLRPRVGWELDVVEGDVPETIAMAAQDPRVDLVMMGFKPGARFWAVHCLDRVLRQVRKPVLAVPLTLAPALAAYWQTIVLATDLDAGAEATQAAARALATVTGAGVTVATVIDSLPPAVSAPDALMLPAYRDFAVQEAQRKLDEAFAPVWPEVSRVVLEGGDPGKEIAALAREKKANLVVVGFHTDKPHLLGSVADRVLNQSVAAVLVVPHAGERRQAKAA